MAIVTHPEMKLIILIIFELAFDEELISHHIGFEHFLDELLDGVWRDVLVDDHDAQK